MVLDDDYMDMSLKTPTKPPKHRRQHSNMTDKTAYEEVEDQFEEPEFSFKVSYNMSKNAKQSLIKAKYGQTQKITSCQEKLERFVL